jgi:hypothetical protein
MTSIRPRRAGVALSLAAALLGAHSGASAALPQPSGSGRTSFTSETTGLPQSTQQGAWTELDGRMYLVTAGGHATDGRTTFAGDWLSPVTDASTSLTGRCEVHVNSDSGRKVKLTLEVRVRSHGRWTGWLGFPQRFADGPSTMSMGFAAAMFTDGPVRYHWRLKGVVPATTQLVARCDVGLEA